MYIDGMHMTWHDTHTHTCTHNVVKKRATCVCVCVCGNTHTVLGFKTQNALNPVQGDAGGEARSSAPSGGG